MSQPVTGRANTVPRWIELVRSVTARERAPVGTQRPIMLIEAGNTAASPSPSAMRARISAGSDSRAAGGVSAVNSDHQMTAAPKMILPPKRLASAPLATIISRYPTKNADSTRPFCVSLQPSWCCIAMAPTEMLVRST